METRTMRAIGLMSWTTVCLLGLVVGCVGGMAIAIFHLRSTDSAFRASCIEQHGKPQITLRWDRGPVVDHMCQFWHGNAEQSGNRTSGESVNAP